MAQPTTAERSLQAWRERLDSPDPLAFQRAVFDLVQTASGIAPESRGFLGRLLFTHRAQQHPELAARWVEGVFRVGGNEAMAALLEHADSGEGSQSSRQLASRRALEM